MRSSSPQFVDHIMILRTIHLFKTSEFFQSLVIILHEIGQDEEKLMFYLIMVNRRPRSQISYVKKDFNLSSIF